MKDVVSEVPDVKMAAEVISAVVIKEVEAWTNDTPTPALAPPSPRKIPDEGAPAAPPPPTAFTPVVGAWRELFDACGDRVADVPVDHFLKVSTIERKRTLPRRSSTIV